MARRRCGRDPDRAGIVVEQGLRPWRARLDDAPAGGGQHVRCIRRRPRDRHRRNGAEQREFADRRADRRLEHDQAHPACGDRALQAHDPLCTDALRLGQPPPLPIDLGFDREAGNAHAQRQILPQPDQVEAVHRRQFQRQRWRGDLVRRGPVAVRLAIEHARRLEPGTARGAGTGLGALGQVDGEAGADRVAETLQHRHVVVGDAAASVGRQIEVHVGTARHRGVEIAHQILRAPHLAVFVGVIEPARTDRGVGFGRPPQRSSAHAGIAVFLGVRPIGHRRPGWIAGDAIFVAAPPDIGTERIEGTCHWLMLMHQLDHPRPVVVRRRIDLARFARPTVIAIAAIGAVEPELEQVAVTCAEFDDLFAEIVQIAGATVLGVVAIPGGEIDAEGQAGASTRRGHLADDVTLAVFVGRIADAVLGQACRPKAESIVMLGSENQPFQIAGLRSSDDLVG